jgi:hypothetical protein
MLFNGYGIDFERIGYAGKDGFCTFRSGKSYLITDVAISSQGGAGLIKAPAYLL